MRLMGRVLREAGDPDHEFLLRAEEGLPVGVREALPRTPSIYERQTKWSLEEGDPDGWVLERPNYPSAVEHQDHLRKHLEGETGEGLMERMTDEAF